MSELNLEAGEQIEVEDQTPQIVHSKAVRERLHMLPDEQTVFDAFYVFEKANVDREELLRSLLNRGKVEFLAQLDSLEVLQHLDITSEREHILGRGQQLVFGFPLVTLPSTNDHDAICAPVALFNTQIKYSVSDQQYRIKIEQAACELNEALLSFLAANYNCRLDTEVVVVLRDKKVDANELLRILNSIANQLGLDDLGTSIGFSAYQKEEDRSLSLAGVLRFVEPYLEKEQAAWLHLQRNNSLQSVFRKSDHVLPVLDLDPTQLRCVQEAFDRTSFHVRGISGTGKTRVAASIAIQALLNKKRVLYIHPQKRGLSAFQKELSDSGLSELIMTIDGSDQMRDRVQDALLIRPDIIKRTRANREQRPPHVFDRFVEQYSNNQSSLVKSHQILRTRFFGEERLTDVTGRFLFSHIHEGRQTLSGHIGHISLEYSPEEFQYLSKAIQISHDPYQTIGTVHHPLRGLHNRFFEYSNVDANTLKSTIESSIQHHLSELHLLRQRGSTVLERYEQRLKDVQTTFYERQATDLSNLQTDASLFSKQFDQDFLRNDGVGNTIQSIIRPFSKKRKVGRQVRTAFLNQVQTFFKQHNQAFFRVQNEELNLNSVDEIQVFLESYKSKLEHSNKQFSKVIDEEVSQLSSTTCSSLVPQFESDAQVFYSGFQDRFQDLEEGQLLASSVLSSARTITDCIQHCKKIEDKLNELLFQMRDFDRFFPWQSIWLTLNTQAQEIISGLVQAKPTSWVHAFESWYFDSLLSEKVDSQLQVNQSHHSKAAQLEISIQGLIQNQVQTIWYKQVEQSKSELKALSKVSDKQQSFFDWLVNHHQIIQSAFPITLSSSEYVDQCTRDIQYDIILIDDVHEIDQSRFSQLVNESQRIIYLSDPLAAENNHNSLAHFLTQSRVTDRFLEFSHVIQSPKVITPFAHAMTTIPTLLSPSMRRIQSTNVYVEKMNSAPLDYGVHEDEARQIIKWLFNQHEQEGRIYSTGQMPKVGICCFTEMQRNFIIQKLREAAQSNAVFQQKLIELEQSGLQVFSLNDVPSERFHVLLVTCVSNDELLDNSRCFIQKDTIAHALQRTSDRVYIAHSFSDHWIAQHTKSPDTFKRILATCLAYYSAVAKNEKVVAQALLSRHQSLRQDTAGSQLAIALKQALLPFLEQGSEIQINVEYQDLTFDLLVKTPQSQQEIVVQLDSATRHWATPHFGWAQKRRAFIESLGYRYIEVYSFDLWQKPDDTIQRLARDLQLST